MLHFFQHLTGTPPFSLFRAVASRALKNAVESCKKVKSARLYINYPNGPLLLKKLLKSDYLLKVTTTACFPSLTVYLARINRFSDFKVASLTVFQFARSLTNHDFGDFTKSKTMASSLTLTLCCSFYTFFFKLSVLYHICASYVYTTVHLLFTEA